MYSNEHSLETKQLLNGLFYGNDRYHPNVGFRIGRIILRNGVSLMEEGVPFTPANDCSYTNGVAPDYNYLVSHSQLCCVEFI